ncbi:MAG: elongation factor G [Planctomycetota bacterium]|nr:MAG: elongation factor G [Planctomycetota bacterium]
MTHTPEAIRNLVLVGHADSGKTSLAEAILHQTGTVGRLGSIQAGTTVLDYTEEEKTKQHSINLAVAHCDYEGTRINIIDTPGYPDFFGDTHCGIVAGDIACLVINAKSGIGLNTRKAWKLADKHGLAKMIVVNKVDMDNVDLDALTESIREAFGTGCVWFRRPNASGGAYSENTDALADPDQREALTEAAVEIDEALMEKYLEEGEISEEEFQQALRKGIIAGAVVPMVGTSATKEIGIKDLLEVVKTYMPSPLQAKPRLDAEGKEVKPDGPFRAQAFKVMVGDFGAQTYIRVFAGETKGHSSVKNLNTGKEERVGDFQFLQGKTPEPVGALVAGDIAVIPKVEGISAGHTLGEGKLMPEIEVPTPMVKLAVTPKTRADETKLRPALDRLEREDLTFKTERNDETNELIIKGMSLLHLETLLQRMKERTKVEVERHRPKVAYRETIRGTADTRYRHKKQSGGAGEFGEVAIRMSPAERGEGLVFENKVVGGAISASYIPAVEKGIRQCMEEGVIAGYKFVDVKIEVYDGKEHPVDSKEAAFIKAGRGAFRQGVEQAKPCLLEPIYEVSITVPDQYTGDIMGDLARRRSQPQGMEQSEEGTVIKALVPEVEMQTYSQDLRSMTSGEGIYEMRFSHYEFLPPDKAAPLIEAYKKAREEGK